MVGKVTQIDVAKDYTPLPGGRYPRDGDGNGTTFRERFLVPVLDRNDRARIVLDGVQGYPSSFLEEAFGGLIRAGYDARTVRQSFDFVAHDPGFSRYVIKINNYIDKAALARR